MQRFVLFGLFCTLTLYAILRLQSFFPWFFSNFQTTPLSPDLAVNTSINFSTTTTWQAHGGENTMSYFSQMVELCAQNFLAGAAGLAVGIAFIRGLARQLSNALGNFWVDLVRTLLWVLLPTASVGALLLVWQGVPMNFNHYAVVTTLEGSKQVIPQGPVAALEIIKNLGTNTSASGHCGEHQAGLSALTTNTGSHGFTGILFAYTSCFANNGKSFAGLSMNTPFYNLTTALAMMVGRLGLAIPALALAALRGRQRNTPKSSGTLPTDSFIFGLLLTACLVTLVALSYLPTES